jgi:hypothetical protein
MKDKELIEKAMDLAKQLDLARSTNYADTILELVKRIEELQPAPKSIVWEPKKGEKYWYVDVDGTFAAFKSEHEDDRNLLIHHNVYKTQGQAEKAAKYQQRYNMVLQAVLNLEPDQVVDWKYKNQAKYGVAFDHRNGAWEYTNRLSIESGHPVLTNSLNVQPLLDYLNSKEKSDDR